jgi:hypothetical protein
VHHENDNVTRVLRTVQYTSATLVELLRACQTAEPAIALRRTLRAFTDGCRVASWARITLPPRAACARPARECEKFNLERHRTGK